MKYSIVFPAILALAASAQANLVTNGSFEDLLGQYQNNDGGGNAMWLVGGASTIPGWIVTGDDIAWIKDPHPYGGTATDGIMSVDLAGFTNAGAPGGVEQTFATVINGVYLVTFDMGCSPTWGNAYVQVSAAGQSQTYFEAAGSGHRWDNHSFTFTANATTSTLRIEEDGGGRTIYAGLDNVIVTLIPEPASSSVLLLAAVGFVRGRTRRAR